MTVKKIVYIFCFFIFLTSKISSDENTQNEIKILKNLRCLVCQGQSIADSNSDFAQSVKLVVKEQIQKGKKEKEIYAFLSNKYGEWIVYKPKLNKTNAFLWLIPYLVLILGGIAIFIMIRKGNKT
jgi:cytochrome c-type biogenesis protein CcmH